MVDLPIERLEYKKPAFTNTSLDCFGPLHVTIRRTTEQRWILLFTCVTIRAIQLEILHSLNTSSCIMAFNRYMEPTFWLDNVTNFVSASREVKTIETPAFQEKCAQRCNEVEIQYSISTQSRRSLEKPDQVMQEDTFSHSRIKKFSAPHFAQQTSNEFQFFVPASSDPTDLNALSPNSFLNSGEVLQPAVFAREPHCAHHRRAYQQPQHYAVAIWTRWLAEYVPNLNSTQVDRDY